MWVLLRRTGPSWLEAEGRELQASRKEEELLLVPSEISSVTEGVLVQMAEQIVSKSCFQNVLILCICQWPCPLVFFNKAQPWRFDLCVLNLRKKWECCSSEAWLPQLSDPYAPCLLPNQFNELMQHRWHSNSSLPFLACLPGTGTLANVLYWLKK